MPCLAAAGLQPRSTWRGRHAPAEVRRVVLTEVRDAASLSVTLSNDRQLSTGGGDRCARDLLERVTTEPRPGGATITTCAYEPPSGRLPFGPAQGTPSIVEGWRR